MRQQKMTISWERYVVRPANEQDVAESREWFKKHPDGAGAPYELGDEIDVEETVELPGKFEVCGRCDGKGSHVNPNIDGHGITEDEWNGPDWDEESQEAYLSGAYDVTCSECHGARVVLEVDEGRCDPILLKEYRRTMDERAREDAADRHTRYMESGGYSEY